MENITTIIPGVPQLEFEKILASLDIKTYRCINRSTIVLYFPSSDRGLRKAKLLELNKLLPNTTYKDDGRSGLLTFTNKSKLFLKPLKTSGGVILKPALFGNSQNKLVDRDIPQKDYYNTVMAAIDTTKEITEDQREVLKAIVKYTTKSITKTELSAFLTHLGDAISINTISNDFGEVLGPLGIQYNNLLPIDFDSAKVFIPKAGNYPLLDYIIRDKDKEFKISAKSGEQTNTLKPGDVKKIIDSTPVLFDKYKNSDVYHVISILSDNSWKEGPLLAGKYLNKRHFHEFDWAVDSISYTELFRQQAENDLVKISKTQLDFSYIFMDAILTNEVYYVKFYLTTSGDMSWKLVRSERVPTKPAKRIVFRSKNFTGRANGDKLGFQI